MHLILVSFVSWLAIAYKTAFQYIVLEEDNWLAVFQRDTVIYNAWICDLQVFIMQNQREVVYPEGKMAVFDKLYNVP